MNVAWPEHEGKTLTLGHNEHKGSYHTVAQEEYKDKDWINAEQQTRAINTNDCWGLRITKYVDQICVDHTYRLAADVALLVPGLEAVLWPKHEGGMTVEHNEWLVNDSSAKNAIEEDFNELLKDDNWVNLEQKAKAIETNSIWTFHWYPDTPIGFNVLHAADWDALLLAILALHAES